MITLANCTGVKAYYTLRDRVREKSNEIIVISGILNEAFTCQCELPWLVLSIVVNR